MSGFESSVRLRFPFEARAEWCIKRGRRAKRHLLSTSCFHFREQFSELGQVEIISALDSGSRPVDVLGWVAPSSGLV